MFFASRAFGQARAQPNGLYLFRGLEADGEVVSLAAPNDGELEGTGSSADGEGDAAKIGKRVRLY